MAKHRNFLGAPTKQGGWSSNLSGRADKSKYLEDPAQRLSHCTSNALKSIAAMRPPLRRSGHHCIGMAAKPKRLERIPNERHENT
jgi:hypothetical protein